MSSNHPDHATMRAALTLALRAPSVHNSQPWLWRIGDRTLHLYADHSRQLPYTDPDGRDLLVSCGAALHHLRVAMRVFGWESTVHRFPNPADTRHLAAVEFHAATPTPEDVRLSRAISRRHSDRRQFTSWEVPATQVATVTAAGTSSGVQVRAIDAPDELAALRRGFEGAATEHSRDPAYRAELAVWSGHHAMPHGVPGRNAVTARDATTRPFGDPGLAETVVHDTDESARMLLLCTGTDDAQARLRAGEAASAVLLAATALGLATCPLSEPLELPEFRDRIRHDILGDFGYPQLIIRMGWAATSGAAVPTTPRLPLDEVLHPLDEPLGSVDSTAR
ncbi:Putative NAD(P)H nitroreductase RV3131/MT3217 [Nocardia otitidiscaviarum]|uniref:NAD(P)H nitroreductase RV3131/MT3217 n=1 Tax=Nocardia otitidiscaviarum TaxID=1823 RepID=A0A379JMC2_9NOCA|nr:NAD(P)H nitroreductase [Nocardia otitidiscaviarum]SUD49371.1 Putative NAD(P)H nitroreductase RV3131/MT3217 [Nocardia otitidiscaviarum]